jgi:hypothetical protein
MLELRPNCEYCDKDLSPNATDALICSYECTFCQHCVETHLNNVCPNCGGGFTARPIRPKNEYRNNVSLLHQIPSTKRILTPYTPEEITLFVSTIKSKPEER